MYHPDKAWGAAYGACSATCPAVDDAFAALEGRIQAAADEAERRIYDWLASREWSGVSPLDVQELVVDELGATVRDTGGLVADAIRAVKEQTTALRAALVDAHAQLMESEARVSDLEYQIRDAEARR